MNYDDPDDFRCKCRHSDLSHVGVPTDNPEVESLGGCKLCDCKEFDLEE